VLKCGATTTGNIDPVVGYTGEPEIDQTDLHLASRISYVHTIVSFEIAMVESEQSRQII
jgi:hypothetical protein